MTELRMYTVYLNAADLEPGYAVREVLVGPGRLAQGPVIAQGLATLAEARDAVPPVADSCTHRAETDDPAIVETWF
jgi:hypothetical protein